MPNTTPYEKEVSLQTNCRKSAVEFVKIVNDLWYDDAVELVIFRNQLIDKNVNEILRLHDYASVFVNKPISIFDAVEVAKAIQNLRLPPSKIDIGKLTYEFHKKAPEHNDIFTFISNQLKAHKKQKNITPRDVVLYGFGRIGRLVARELMLKNGKGSQLRLRAIVTRGSVNKDVLEKRAALLSNDSVHGKFPGTIHADSKKNALIINGTTVHIISSNAPEDIDYTTFGIEKALIIDNTGAFRTKEALERHLKANGTEKVVLTAPGNGIPNIVYGVNQNEYNPKEHSIFSAASCTTNAITPVLSVIDDALGVNYGHLETIHAYTNDQNLVDNMHKKYRRGRAAGLNMVITETGAGKAVSKALPKLEGKLTSNAIRVPVPNGSLAILNLEVSQKITLKKLNHLLKQHALEGPLVEQIKYELSDELVSSDIVGSSAPAIFDSKATIVRDNGKNIVLYIWYDNEYGYSHQVVRLAKYMAEVRRFTYY
ncbi:glyceraldehyde-3-phosphate dehydrogenase [Flavobacteriaceae bacterium]|nr:glyceraldehyde-3-phosphate dehydrogenase [Flavobacteriaceae bacterium]MDB2631860.1 glyceraldehyde-3-phosphate dehydrogenase [Flavobacteriaceae bacterium]